MFRLALYSGRVASMMGNDLPQALAADSKPLELPLARRYVYRLCHHHTSPQPSVLSTTPC